EQNGSPGSRKLLIGSPTKRASRRVFLLNKDREPLGPHPKRYGQEMISSFKSQFFFTQAQPRSMRWDHGKCYREYPMPKYGSLEKKQAQWRPRVAYCCSVSRTR